MRAACCEATVLRHEVIADDIRLLTALWPDREHAPHAGQFFTLRAWGADEAPFLSRPISVHKWDAETQTVAGIVKVSTDTGAVGFHGFVTQLYDPADYDVVLVCGPTVMMRNAARLCAEKGTPCFVSLEKKMACGIGACLGCTCETRSGEGKSVCKNGPVFDAAEVF